jgi:hypothetical protein
MKRYHLFIGTVLLLVAGCGGGNDSRTHSGEEEEEGGGLVTLSVDRKFLSDVKAYGLDQVASELIYIPLETNRNCLLRSVNKIVFAGENMLVSDFERLYLFNGQGKFLRQISRTGQGPAEYYRVFDIFADADSREFYLIADSRKMLKYTFEGDYIRTISTKLPSHTALMTPDHTLLFHIPNQTLFTRDTTVYSLEETDTLGHVLRSYPNRAPLYSEIKQLGLTVTGRSLYVYGKNIYFAQWASDTLFMVSGDTLTAKLAIDLGDLKLDPVPDLSRFNNNPPAGANYIKSMTKLAISMIWEDQTCYYIRIIHGFDSDNGEEHCIYIKQAKDFICLGTGGELVNNLDGGLPFFPRKVEPDGTKIMWKDAAGFREEILSKDYEVQKAGYGERFEKVYRLAQSLREDDNPVLILAK